MFQPLSPFIPEDAIPFHQVRRVLLIKLRQLGDVLLTSPVFSVLKQHYPEMQLDVLIYAEARPLLAHHPAITNIYTVNRNWKSLSILNRIQQELALAWTLRCNHYDLVINLTEGDRGAFAALISGSRWRVGCHEIHNAGFIGKQRIFTHLYRVQEQQRHIVEQHLDALRRVGLRIPLGYHPLHLSIPEAARQAALFKLQGSGWQHQPYILISPTSRCVYKCLPPHTVAAVIEAIHQSGYQIVLTCGPHPAEMYMIQEILNHTNTPILNLGGKLELLELGAIIAQAKVFLGGDSLPMHMAAALQIPTVAWFGPLPNIVWGPWQVPNRVVTMDINCRPCGYQGCGDGLVAECLMSLKADTIIAAWKELMVL